MDAESYWKKKNEKQSLYFGFYRKKIWESQGKRMWKWFQTKIMYEEGRCSFANCMPGLYINHRSDRGHRELGCDNYCPP